MKNKFLIISISFILVGLFGSGRLSAQLTSQANAQRFEVDSYNGKIAQGVFTYTLNLSGRNFNHNNWSMMVRAPYITNIAGKTIDPSRISIRLNRITGGPSIQDIGANQTPIPLSYNDQYLFEKTSYPLKHKWGEDRQYVFEFDIIVSGGAYLEDLKNFWLRYWLNLEFTVELNNGQRITDANATSWMKIYPTDIPPSGPTYGIEVNSNAKNGLLEFKSVTDYVNGVEQVYENGLSVISDTPYQVQVRSLTSNFEADNNLTLPISTVRLQIQDPKNSGVGGTIILSENLQTVFSATNQGSGNKPRDFNLRYFTQPNDERMINAKPASYKTTLMYTLMPQ